MDNIKYGKQVKEDIGVVLDDSFFHEGLKPKDIRRIMKKFYKNWSDELFAEYLHKFGLSEKRVKEYSKV